VLAAFETVCLEREPDYVVVAGDVNSTLAADLQGGILEETTAPVVPCITLRENTKRPITIRQGTNRLVGNEPARLACAVDEVLSGRWPTGSRPTPWDGHAAERVVDILSREIDRPTRIFRSILQGSSR
jgi:UDP-N-acetylglucosamine 2-epimerase (non-hydrolysing)